MKKILATILSIVLILSVCPLGLFGITASAATGNTTEFAGGSGTADDPYLISTKYHLDNVRFYPSSCFKVIRDIKFTDSDFTEDGDFYNDGEGWEPIGYTTDSFTGVFDGGMHSIANLYFNRTENYLGLFGTVKDEGRISNIVLYDVKFTGKDYLGGIAGRLISSKISMCYVSGEIEAYK